MGITIDKMRIDHIPDIAVISTFVNMVLVYKLFTKMFRMKTWLKETIDEDEHGNTGTGKKWKLFAWLIQSIWEQGCLHGQMQQLIVVLLPKSGSNFSRAGRWYI